MQDLLYLVHRLPFPPNKGDKIRSYHVLKHLSERYRVFLGTFIDDPDDWQYVDQVKAMCAETMIVPLHPFTAKIKSMAGFVQGAPLTLAYYRHATLQAWVDTVLATRQISHALVFSSAMAQYLDGHRVGRRLIDFVDVDSDKWRQYALSKRWPLSYVYRREAQLLLTYERTIAAEFDMATFVSSDESALFKRLAPESATKIRFFNNGVDADYFSPQRPYANPYPPAVRPLVFTGVMDYWANAEAVDWFAHQVLPIVRASCPNAAFYIVGARPTAHVSALGQLEGVTVTGSVPDVRPYLAHAALSVAPLRIARGIQNKVLEAMAMAKIVIASPEAAEGLQLAVRRALFVAHDEREFAALILSYLQGNEQLLIGHVARACVMHRYNWQRGMKLLDTLLSPCAVQPDRSAVRPCTNTGLAERDYA